MKRIFFFLLPILAFSFCNNPQTTNKRFFECYVRFLNEERMVRAEATFREAGQDGRPVRVPMPGGVQFQGIDMRALQGPNPGYVYEQPGAYQPDLQFDWRDAAGKTGRLQARMGAVSSFHWEPKEPRTGQPARLLWQGGALEKGESLILLWENVQTRKRLNMQVQSGGNESIEFPSVKMAELSAGDWQLYIVRQKTFKHTDGQMEMSGLLEYFSDTDTVRVRP